MIAYIRDRRQQHWIWRCHIDTTKPNSKAWSFISPFIKTHDHLVFTMIDYVHPDLQDMGLSLITPIVDPLHPKSRFKTVNEAAEILSRYRIDPAKPILAQVSRFDPWKDPLGVIELYRLVKRKVPEVQLVYSGPLALDDPEATGILDAMKERIASLKEEGIKYNENVFFLHNQMNPPFTYEETAALWSNPSTVIVQLSTREGFGMVVSEALWLKKAVIGTRRGGIVSQIVDGKTGFLVEPRQLNVDPQDWDYSKVADKVLTLIRNPRLALQMGRSAREHVRKNFLVTTGIRNYLKLFADLV